MWIYQKTSKIVNYVIYKNEYFTLTPIGTKVKILLYKILKLSSKIKRKPHFKTKYRNLLLHQTIINLVREILSQVKKIKSNFLKKRTN